MIVRILGEGQYEISDDVLATLESLDEELNAAIESGEEEAYRKALDALLAKVRSSGRPLEPSALVPSDLALPHEGSTIEDIKELLASEPDASHTVREGA